MKTLFYILTALIALQVSTLSAGNFTSLVKSSDGYDKSSEFVLSRLVPITPKLADFNDEVNIFVLDPATLKPVVPSEADFPDTSAVSLPSLQSLAPVVPPVADFE